MLMLRKDHDSWKRVEGLMDHWEAWKQIPQVAVEEYRISYIVVIPKQIYLCTFWEAYSIVLDSDA